MSLEHRHMPDSNRLSVLLATVLLAYALAQLVEATHYAFRFNMLGIDFSFPFDVAAAATLMAVGLTATGMDWLLRGHPHYTGGRTFEHWILPALTAFILGVPLYTLHPGPLWWASFTIGGVLLLGVLLAEYIALDYSDVRHPAASAMLMALSYALFVILVSTLAYSKVRLVLLALAVFCAAGMVILRAIHLRTGAWEMTWSAAGAFILTQLAAGLHYWPLTPVQYGLALMGPLYALTGLALNVREGVSPWRLAFEALGGLSIFWGVALLLRG